MNPPYLLTAQTDHRGVGVVITGDASTTIVEMAAYGPWSDHLGDQMSTGLRLCLAGPSASIIIDLRHTTDPYGISLRFWPAAWRRARLEAPPVLLVFCLPETAALSRRLSPGRTRCPRGRSSR